LAYCTLVHVLRLPHCEPSTARQPHAAACERSLAAIRQPAAHTIATACERQPLGRDPARAALPGPAARRSPVSRSRAEVASVSTAGLATHPPSAFMDRLFHADRHLPSGPVPPVSVGRLAAMVTGGTPFPPTWPDVRPCRAQRTRTESRGCASRTTGSSPESVVWAC
jgi:hypothetical protein